jgi:hypothetical protein
MIVLGISAYYHDSAASIARDGTIVNAAQEERFSRKKHDSGFPANAIRWCLADAGVTAREVDRVAFYDKPFLKFERLLETYLAFAPRSFRSFRTAMPVWLGEKLFQKDMLLKELRAIDEDLGAASISMASRSSARRRMRSTASWERRSRCLRSATASCARPSRRPRSSATIAIRSNPIEATTVAAQTQMGAPAATAPGRNRASRNNVRWSTLLPFGISMCSLPLPRRSRRLADAAIVRIIPIPPNASGISAFSAAVLWLMSSGQN